MITTGIGSISPKSSGFCVCSDSLIVGGLVVFGISVMEAVFRDIGLGFDFWEDRA